MHKSCLHNGFRTKKRQFSRPRTKGPREIGPTMHCCIRYRTISDVLFAKDAEKAGQDDLDGDEGRHQRQTAGTEDFRLAVCFWITLDRRSGPGEGPVQNFPKNVCEITCNPLSYGV